MAPSKPLILSALLLTTALLALAHFHRKATAPSTIPVHTFPPSLLPTATNGRRLIIVGDIHGCLTELQSLLAETSFDPATDSLLATGDVLAKGPSSAPVLALLRSLGATCVRGNHEQKLLDELSHPTLYPAEVAKKPRHARALAHSLSTEHIGWVRETPVIVRLGHIPALLKGEDAQGRGEVILVHGGLDPRVALEEQDANMVMNMRSFAHAGEEMKASAVRGAGTPWYDVWADAQRESHPGNRAFVVYGHDARTGLRRDAFSAGLDSACVVGGRLSALVVTWNAAEAISVPCAVEGGHAPK